MIEPLPDQYPWCEHIQFDNGDKALPRRESLKVVKPRKTGPKGGASLEDGTPLPVDDASGFVGDDTALPVSMWPEDGAT